MKRRLFWVVSYAWLVDPAKPDSGFALVLDADKYWYQFQTVPDPNNSRRSFIVTNPDYDGLRVPDFEILACGCERPVKKLTRIWQDPQNANNKIRYETTSFSKRRVCVICSNYLPCKNTK